MLVDLSLKQSAGFRQYYTAPKYAKLLNWSSLSLTSFSAHGCGTGIYNFDDVILIQTKMKLN